jgi:hypothetical protein
MTLCWIQNVSFMLFFFVCPWPLFSEQSGLDQFFTIQLIIVYPLVQAFQFGLIFYLSSFYLKYRKLTNNVIQTKHYSILIFIAYLFAMLQALSMILRDEAGMKDFWFLRIPYPVGAITLLFMSIHSNTHSIKLLVGDLNDVDHPYEQTKILMYKLQATIS